MIVTHCNCALHALHGQLILHNVNVCELSHVDVAADSFPVSFQHHQKLPFLLSTNLLNVQRTQYLCLNLQLLLNTWYLRSQWHAPNAGSHELNQCKGSKNKHEPHGSPLLGASLYCSRRRSHATPTPLLLLPEAKPPCSRRRRSGGTPAHVRGCCSPCPTKPH